jgi:hypothetical protein
MNQNKDLRNLAVVVAVVAAAIGFTVGFSAGVRVAERLVRIAIIAAADEIRASTYAPIVAASIIGGTAILCAILLPVMTVVTLHRLDRRSPCEPGIDERNRLDGRVRPRLHDSD